MKRRVLLLLPLATLAGCRGLSSATDAAPTLPADLMAAVPRQSRQVLLVLSPRSASVRARAWCLEKERGTDYGTWRVHLGPFPVALGRNGLAWGRSAHTSPTPPTVSPAWRIKHEGDGCAPAGIFRLPFAFGSAPRAEAGWLRLPYRQTSPTLRGVDDPASRFYNQVVDETRLPGGAAKDWTSSEDMLRADGLYEWGAFVAHNSPDVVAGADARGSCIFLHLWRGPGRGTAGCTAMSRENLRAVLAWINPTAEPVLVQTVK